MQHGLGEHNIPTAVGGDILEMENPRAHIKQSYKYIQVIQHNLIKQRKIKHSYIINISIKSLLKVCRYKF